MQKYTDLVSSISTKPTNMLQSAMGSNSQPCQMGNVPLSHPQIQPRNHSPTLLPGSTTLELGSQVEQGNVIINYNIKCFSLLSSNNTNTYPEIKVALVGNLKIALLVFNSIWFNQPILKCAVVRARRVNNANVVFFFLRPRLGEARSEKRSGANTVHGSGSRRKFERRVVFTDGVIRARKYAEAQKEKKPDDVHLVSTGGDGKCFPEDALS